MERAMSAASQRDEPVKEPSMLKQKAMIADNYDKLTGARELGRKVAATYVPGNLNELLMCFDMLNNLPEINAIQNGMRKQSGKLIMDAEKMGHSEDVCTSAPTSRPTSATWPKARSRRTASRCRRPTCCCCPIPAASPS
jgi:hypothetical protein